MEEKKAEIGFSYLGERRQSIDFRRGKQILKEDNVLLKVRESENIV